MAKLALSAAFGALPPEFERDPQKSIFAGAWKREDAAATCPSSTRSILYNWPVVGWCVGTIKARNTDGRITKMIDTQSEKVNFYIYYEIDGEEVKTVLRSAEHGGDEDGAWVLLESVEPVE